MISEKNSVIKWLCSAFFIVLAIALQIQISLFTSENYIGLRINSADLFLPVMGTIIIASLLLKKSCWPQFHIRHVYFWLAVLGLVLAGALANFYWTYGTLNQWGLVNKLIGWGILSGYFLIGAWLICNADKNQFFLFVKIAVYFFTLTAIIYCLKAILQFYGVSQDFYRLHLPIEGFMANKNSFIFLGLSVLGLATCFHRIIFPDWFIVFIWFLMPSLFVCTGARAGLLALPFVFLILLIFQYSSLPWKKIGMGIIAGLFFIFFVKVTVPADIFKLYKVTASSADYLSDLVKGEESFDVLDEKMKFYGDVYRLKVLDTARNMIIERPLLGSGLGAAKREQEKQWGKFYTIIDSTPVWLWAETGLIGLCLFLSFYFICFKQIWKNGRFSGGDEAGQALSRSVLIILVVFSVMCLFHEILYTRFMWFFMGMALACPVMFKSENKHHLR